MKNIVKKNWLFLLIVIQPILDIIAYFQYDSKMGTLAGYIRLVIMCIITVYALWENRKDKNHYILLGIIALYCILHILNGFRVGYLNIFEDVSYMAKVVQMPLLAISFCYLFKSELYKKQVINGMVINLIVIVISMILAFLTKSGDYTYRIYKIGYTGWFANANSQSIILIIIIPFVLYFVHTKKKIIFDILFAVSATIVLLVNGTKASYLSIIIILGGCAFFYILDWMIEKDIKRKKKTQLAVAFLYLIIIGISVVAYPLTPRYEMDTLAQGKRIEENAKIEEKKESIVHEDSNEDAKQKSEMDELLLENENKKKLMEIYKDELNSRLVNEFGEERVLEAYGWTPDSYTLADVRLQKRIFAQLLWEDSDFLTRMFGIEFTHMAEGDLENDYAAIYYYYGYVGFALIILFLIYFLGLVIKAAINNWQQSFNLFNYLLILSYALQIGLAQFSGAIFRRPNASIYMSITLALIFYQCKNILNKNQYVEDNINERK